MEIQKETHNTSSCLPFISEAAFYSDWLLESLRLPQWSNKNLVKIRPLLFRDSSDEKLTLKASLLFEELKQNNHLLLQERVRSLLSQKKVTDDILFPELKKYFSVTMRPQTLDAFFYSKLLHFIFNHLSRVEGLIQFDQYHRLSVDEHTLKAIKTVLQLYKKPSLFGRQLKKAIQNFNKAGFEEIHIVQSESHQATISFKARDQKGLLLRAAQEIAHQGLSIRSARIHTWGRQVDDIFVVDKQEGSLGWDYFLNQLRQALL